MRADLSGAAAAISSREQPGRNQLAVLEVGLLVLVRLARVDQDDVAALDLLRSLERLDLLDCRLHLRIRTVRHWQIS